MTSHCQVSELSFPGIPEFYQLYQYSPERYPFFLTSTTQSSSHSSDIHQNNDGYDILFIEPGHRIKLDNNGLLSSSSEDLSSSSAESFLDYFNQHYLDTVSNRKNDTEAGISLPFRGGWFIFLSYEIAGEVEPILTLPRSEQTLPIAYAARVEQALIFDHQQQRYFFITESGIDHQQSYDTLLADMSCVKEQTREIPKQDKNLQNDLLADLQEEDDSRFLKAVERVKQYILDGDVFQVNMSRLWRSSLPDVQHHKLAAALYKKLSRANPAPFSGLATFMTEDGAASIISSSPERLLSIKNNQLSSRPIAGTHPRSMSLTEDQQLLEHLHNHPKEQAEHIMLIDLIRNDLGRVCSPGTVTVDELMVNESYAHVHHIVSNVTGELQAGKTPVDAIRALFPGGTITGCPKVRCMEIIAELEHCSRGAYTGSMGYINLDGSMDLNILIRTMVLEQSGSEHSEQGPVTQQLSFRAGAGLVFDSIAHKELQETRAKAKGLLKALEAER